MSLDEYKGYQLLSLRVWTKTAGMDESVATSKGFGIQVIYARQLLEAIERAVKVSESEALIEADTEREEK